MYGHIWKIIRFDRFIKELQLGVDVKKQNEKVKLVIESISKKQNEKLQPIVESKFNKQEEKIQQQESDDDEKTFSDFSVNSINESTSED